jgi:hypothetical protein
MRRIFGALPLLLIAITAAGQNISIGSNYYTSAANLAEQNVPAVRTEINPNMATANGRLESVHVYWTNYDCMGQVKFKIFRRNGDTLTPVEERGPFAPTQNDFSVLFIPGIEVQQGDLIGVTRSGDCGEPGLQAALPTVPSFAVSHMIFSGDVTAPVGISSGTVANGQLMLYGSGPMSASITYSVPVVGSVAGAYGSQFRTRVQLLNPKENRTPLTGTMIFHPAGRPGQQSDPSISYSIEAGHVVTYTDLVAAMGQTGLGTLDFLIPRSSQLPVVTVRVFNDEGSGTTGFTERVVRMDDVDPIDAYSSGYLVLPPDPATERFSIGIRTLYEGARVTLTLNTGDGTTIASVTKTWLPNVFEQIPVETLFDKPIGGNYVVGITVETGSALVHGTTTDNRTNDPAIQMLNVKHFYPL